MSIEHIALHRGYRHLDHIIVATCDVCEKPYDVVASIQNQCYDCGLTHICLPCLDRARDMLINSLTNTKETK